MLLLGMMLLGMVLLGMLLFAVTVLPSLRRHEITHVTGSIDPGRDIDIINTELVLADLEVIDRRMQVFVLRTNVWGCVFV